MNRIEVLAPVYDEDMRRDLLRTIDYGLKDTSNGRLVSGDGEDVIQQPEIGDSPFRSQEMLQMQS